MLWRDWRQRGPLTGEFVADMAMLVDPWVQEVVGSYAIQEHPRDHHYYIDFDFDMLGGRKVLHEETPANSLVTTIIDNLTGPAAAIP